MTAKRYLIRGWRLGLLALLASALSLGFNGNGCNLTDDTNSGSSTVLIIKANSHSIVKDHDPNPESELNVPAQAVDNDTEVAFIPFRQKEDLPEPLPAGCEFLGGANLKPKHNDKADFNNGKEADCYVGLPDNVRAEELSTTDIKLMEFIDGHWVIVLPDKKGKVHTDGHHTGYIGPDEENPAKLTGIRPFCWAIINDPAIIQSLYNLWLTISADSNTGSAGPTIPIPPVLILPPITPPVIAPPPTVIVPPALTTGPIAWWKLDDIEGSTAFDSSGNNNHGKVYGATWSGGSLSFDGVNDYVDIGNLVAPGTQDWTVESWVKMSSFGQSGCTELRNIIISQRHTEYDHSLTLYVGAHGNQTAQAAGFIHDGSYIYYGGKGTNPLLDGKWHHIVGVRKQMANGEHYSVYVDGTLEADNNYSSASWAGSPQASNANITSSNRWHIGHQGAWNSWFKGQMDEVKIYNYARSATQIKTDYDSHVQYMGISYGLNWILMKPANAPSARFGVAMAYDSDRQKTVIFGGSITGYDKLGETWEYDGINWTQKAPAHSPSIRGFSAIAYDPVRQKTVLFGGGYYGSVYFNDTWEWDGTDWTLRAPVNKPSARVWPVMVYDSARRKMVLFGGFYEGNYRNDTWEWDGTNWTQRSSETVPPGRHYHAMAYDSARQKTVLFGGWTAWDTTTNQTWEWDGTNWTLKSPVNKPTARLGSAMAYDPIRGKTTLFGGSSYDDTWEWDGINWTQLMPKNYPSKRSQHKMVYDSTRRKILLFGGATPTGASNETWEYGNIAYYPPNTQVPFQIVLSPTATGWEIDGVGKSCILKENGIYKMWYRGNNYWWAGSYYQNDGSIGYAESADGVNWSNRQRVHLNGTVLNDYRLATDPWVMKEGGTYRMWQADYYTWIGGDWSYYITHLTSPDGVNWANEKTVLTGSGNLSNYDDYCTSQPSLVKEADGSYSMWYAVNQRPRVGVGGPSNIARASSVDGITWTNKQLALARVPGTPEENVLEPDVIKEPDGTYTMYYTATSGPDSVIYRATSADGINWTGRRQILIKTQLRSDILGISSPHYFKDTDGTEHRSDRDSEYLYFSLSLPATEKTGYKEYIGRILLRDIIH